jgi:hypothetical protein
MIVAHLALRHPGGTLELVELQPGAARVLSLLGVVQEIP